MAIVHHISIMSIYSIAFETCSTGTPAYLSTLFMITHLHILWGCLMSVPHMVLVFSASASVLVLIQSGHSLSMTSYLFSLLMITTHTQSSPYVTLIKPFSSLSHSSLLPTCFSSSLEPASCVTPNSSDPNYSSLLATFVWTCLFNLLHTAITFRPPVAP